MVVIKKLKRSTLEILSLSKIFGAAILFVIANITIGSELKSRSVPLAVVAAPVPNIVNSSSISGSPIGESDIFLNGATPIPAPDPAVVCEGTNASFSVTGGATHQWEVSIDGGSTWSSLAGKTTTSLTLISVSYSMNGYVYRCQIDGIPSASATLTVNRFPTAAGVIAATTPVCQGDVNKSFSVAPIANATSYTWTFPSGATVVL